MRRCRPPIQHGENPSVLLDDDVPSQVVTAASDPHGPFGGADPHQIDGPARPAAEVLLAPDLWFALAAPTGFEPVSPP